MAVFDQGYQRWKGEFERPRLRWLPMVRYQIALTLKRRLIWLILFLAIVPSLGFCGVIYFSTELADEFVRVPDIEAVLGGPSPEDRLNPLIEQAVSEISRQRGIDEVDQLSRADKYWIATCYAFYFFLMVPQSFVVLLVTSAVGAGLIAQDVRSNALEIYLTKPITALDYILGKLAVIVFFILLTTFLPSMLVFSTAAMTLQGYFDVAWPIVPRLLGACLFASLVNGIFMLGLSSLAKSSRYATVIWFALCMVSALASFVLAGVTENAHWLFLGYRNNFSFLIGEMFGGGLMFTIPRGEPVVASPMIPIAILGAIVLLSVVIMRKTIRSAENR